MRTLSNDAHIYLCVSSVTKVLKQPREEGNHLQWDILVALPKLGVKAPAHVRGPQASKGKGGHPTAVVRTPVAVVLIAQWLFNVTVA